jgi:hypothetical protein
MFYTPGLIFGSTEGVVSCFHVLRSRAHFRLYRRCRVQFSYFALTGHIFDGTEGVGSRFHVLRSQTRFRRYRLRRAPLSCFAISDPFSAVPRASGPVILFCTPGLLFGGTDVIGSCFHVLRSRSHFWPYRRRRVPFSSFLLRDSFSTVPRASSHVFMICAPEPVFSGTDGVGSRFNVLHSWNRFRWYRRRRVPFSSFALHDSFSAVPRASCPVFMFCAPRRIFYGADGIRSRFHVLPSRTHFWRY